MKSLKMMKHIDVRQEYEVNIYNPEIVFNLKHIGPPQNFVYRDPYEEVNVVEEDNKSMQDEIEDKLSAVCVQSDPDDDPTTKAENEQFRSELENLLNEDKTHHFWKDISLGK